MVYQTNALRHWDSPVYFLVYIVTLEGSEHSSFDFDKTNLKISSINRITDCENLIFFEIHQQIERIQIHIIIISI